MPTPENKRRRRLKRRLVAVAGFLLLATGMAWFFESQATTTVILIRHADRVAGQEENPGLSRSGEQRAKELARVLADIDVIAGVDAIFATQYRRTQETAEPLSKRLQVPVRTAAPDNIEGLIKQILTEYKGKIVLVITHSDAIPKLIQELHGSKKLPPIEANEYDNIYIVSIPWFGKVKTLRLRYGRPYVP
ncbi:MAG: phosphoglycerate mutase family protein [Gammaproteobacteria bacterium]